MTPEIRNIPIGDIEPAAYNPRVPATEGTRLRADLEASLATFGLVLPLVWNQRSGRLVGGHQRFAVLVDSGATELPCAVVDLPDAQEKALNLALNRIGGEWQPDKLNALLGDLGRDPELTSAAGFSTAEVESLRQLATLDAQLGDLKSQTPQVRTDLATDRDAPSATEFPPAAEGLRTIADSPERFRKVGEWIRAWQGAVRSTPTEFAEALDNPPEPEPPSTNPIAAAVAVQTAIERTISQTRNLDA